MGRRIMRLLSCSPVSDASRQDQVSHSRPPEEEEAPVPWALGLHGRLQAWAWARATCRLRAASGGHSGCALRTGDPRRGRRPCCTEAFRSIDLRWPRYGHRRRDSRGGCSRRRRRAHAAVAARSSANSVVERFQTFYDAEAYHQKWCVRPACCVGMRCRMFTCRYWWGTAHRRAHSQNRLLQRRRPLFVSLGLCEPSELFTSRAATLLNAFAASRLSEEAFCTRLRALLRVPKLRAVLLVSSLRMCTYFQCLFALCIASFIATAVSVPLVNRAILAETKWCRSCCRARL